MGLAGGPTVLDISDRLSLQSQEANTPGPKAESSLDCLHYLSSFIWRGTILETGATQEGIP